MILCDLALAHESRVEFHVGLMENAASYAVIYCVSTIAHVEPSASVRSLDRDGEAMSESRPVRPQKGLEVVARSLLDTGLKLTEAIHQETRESSDREAEVTVLLQFEAGENVPVFELTLERIHDLREVVPIDGIVFGVKCE